MTIDIPTLKRLATEATKGPWTTERPRQDVEGWTNGVAICAVYGGTKVYANPPGGQFPASDAAFIAALNPTTALALIERLEKAEAERDKALKLASHHAAKRIEAELQVQP